MRIRPVAAEDFEAIAALTNEYIARSAVNFSTNPVAAADLRAEWEATRDKYVFVVAESEDADDGRVVGFAKAMQFRTRGAYAWSAEVGVYVDPGLQRQGVASAMYARVIEVSRRQGYHSLVAGIALPNEPSVKLHEKLGFTSVGVFKEIGFKLGSFHDLGFWQLLLTTSASPPADPIRSASSV